MVSMEKQLVRKRIATGVAKMVISREIVLIVEVADMEEPLVGVTEDVVVEGGLRKTGSRGTRLRTKGSTVHFTKEKKGVIVIPTHVSR